MSALFPASPPCVPLLSTHFSTGLAFSPGCDQVCPAESNTTTVSLGLTLLLQGALRMYYLLIAEGRVEVHIRD